MRMLFCRHVLVDLDRRHEWHRVRLRLTVMQRLVPHVLFATIILLFTRDESPVYRCVFLAAMALMIEVVLGANSRGKERDVAIELDGQAGILNAPLAGLEVEMSHVTGFALREVRQWGRRRGELNRHPDDFICFYVSLADGAFLPLVAESLQQSRISGFQSAARRFAEAVGLPLMEPEQHHQPTPINPST